MLLATKSVGDFFGVRGIADEMIRFNGFPYLEKEDHAFHTAGKSYFKTFILALRLHIVVVSSVMRKDLYTLPASGMTVHEVGMPISLRGSSYESPRKLRV